MKLRIRHLFYPKLAVTGVRHAWGACTALAGGFAELAAAAQGVRATRPCSCWPRGGTPPLTEAQGDQLWLLFRVPAYLLRLDERGRIMGP